MDEWLEMRFHGNEEVIPKFRRIDREFLSVLQSDRCQDDSNFIIDLDDVTETTVDDFERQLSAVTTVRLRRPTPNGAHPVTEPFDHTQFQSDIEYELKPDDLLFVSSLDT